MTDIADTVRITSASTWTEVAGASASGKTAIPNTDRGYLDITICNFDADANTVLIALTADSTTPSADTEAFYTAILSASAAGSNAHVVTLERVYLPEDAHIWVKSDQTDTRVLVNGLTEAAS